MDDAIDRTTVGTGALARLLGLTPQRVNQLATAGVISKLGRGRFQVGLAVRAYVTLLREQPGSNGAGGPHNYGEERARLTKLQADLLELELAQVRGSMISIDDAVGPLGEQCQTIRAKFLQLASRIAPRVAGQDTKGAHGIIFKEVCEILRELTCDAEAALKADQGRPVKAGAEKPTDDEGKK